MDLLVRVFESMGFLFVALGFVFLMVAESICCCLTGSLVPLFLDTKSVSSGVGWGVDERAVLDSLAWLFLGIDNRLTNDWR